MAPGSSRRGTGQPGYCAHNDIPSGRDSRGQNLTFDGTKGLGGGTSPMSVMYDPPPTGYIVQVAVTRSLSSCSVARFGVGGFFGPRRQAPSSLTRTSGDSGSQFRASPTRNGIWKFECPLLFGSGGVWSWNPKSTRTAGELEGALVRVMYQGVCAGLQG